MAGGTEKKSKGPGVCSWILAGQDHDVEAGARTINTVTAYVLLRYARTRIRDLAGTNRDI
jgi:hypothetical protein